MSALVVRRIMVALQLAWQRDQPDAVAGFQRRVAAILHRHEERRRVDDRTHATLRVVEEATPAVEQLEPISYLSDRDREYCERLLCPACRARRLATAAVAAAAAPAPTPRCDPAAT